MFTILLTMGISESGLSAIYGRKLIVVSIYGKSMFLNIFSNIFVILSLMQTESVFNTLYIL